MKKIVLIDGHSILHRAFYGIPDLTNSEGLHTNAVYGFLNILFRILDEEAPEYLAVAFDLHAPTFRHKVYEEYKGTRKPMPEELREQVPVLKEVLRAMGICVMEQEGLEADDILGTIGRRMEAAGHDVVIVSGDRDLLQLAGDHILIRIPKTKPGRTEIENYRTQEVLDKYQILPPRIVDLKALMGDSSDNITGVPSIGEKTATKLLVEYGTLENIYAHLDEVKPPRAQKALSEHKDMADLSYFLAAIKTDGDIDWAEEQALIGDFYTPEAYIWFKKLEFKHLLNRFRKEEIKEPYVDSFHVIEDFAEAEEIWKKVRKQKAAGCAVYEDLAGVSLSMEEGTYLIPASGFMTGAYLKEQVTALLLSGMTVYVLDLKDLMHKISWDPETPFQPQIVDVALADYVNNPLKNEYAYVGIAKEYDGTDVPGKQELFGKKKEADILSEEASKYLNYQAATAFRCGPMAMERLKENGMEDLYRTIELPLVPVLYDMEYRGVRVLREELSSYGRNLEAGIAQLEADIYEAAGETFNIQSPKQLGVILFEKLQLPAGKKTKTGYSTSAEVLEKLAGEHKIVKDILNYRQLAKLKSTYADGLAAYIGADEKIHTTFQQMITATGRLSSTEPNLQNIPVRMELGRQLRKIFVPSEGNLFLDADYSQVELRILASLSEDQNLIQAYKDARDIHRTTASQVFHIPFDEVTDLERRNAKAVNFGIVYGISSFGLSQDLSISRKEAEMYIKSYFETYPGVKAYLDRTVAEAKETGYTTTVFGRRRPIPELKSSNFMQRAFGERIAMNSPIQGTAADIMKIAMISVWKRLREEGLRSRMVLQVHDELLIDTLPEEQMQVEFLLKECMMQAADLAVSLETEVHHGENWLDAK